MPDLGDQRPTDWMTSSTVKGLRALVVGAGSGMGAAVARAFAANGGSVMVADLNGTTAAEVAAEITSNGDDALSESMDVANERDISRVVDRTSAELGGIDVLVNVATLVKPAMLDVATREDWDAGFRVNVWGPLALAQACLPHLRRSPAPSIVHAGSLAGMNGYAGSGSYGPSKGALIAMSKQMALEWAVEGIRVNVVVPGTILTPALARDLTPVAIATRKKQVPLGRLSFPSEQADVALFLASPASSFVTGQVFVCDGGFSQSLFPQPMGMSETLLERAARTGAALPPS